MTPSALSATTHAVVGGPPGTIGPAPKLSQSFAGSFFFIQSSIPGSNLQTIRRISSQLSSPSVCSLSAEIRSNLPPSNLQPIHRNSAQLFAFSICRLSAEIPPSFLPLDLQTVRNRRLYTRESLRPSPGMERPSLLSRLHVLGDVDRVASAADLCLHPESSGVLHPGVLSPFLAAIALS